MINKLINEILHPPSEFTPIPFWFLNDEFNFDKLKNQLIDFKEKGVEGVVLHPRIGVPQELEYLSEKYFEYIKFIVKTAKELGMLVVLYDEAMYPSGSAHGLVVKDNPEFASVGITISETNEDGKIIIKLDDGKYIIQKQSKGTIRGIHFGEDDGESNAPLSSDILNPKAIEKFIKLTHEKYYENLKEYFGNTIIGFFTDEPCVLGRSADGFFPWTDGLEEDIISLGGRLTKLEGLFNKKENETVKIYHDIVKKRLNRVYYKELSDWCANHNISLMGHPERSDDIDEEQYFHIPGQDLVFRWVSPEMGGTVGVHSVQAKCSSDAARHTGKRRNSNECFGVCVRDEIPWYFTGGDMKWFIDWLGVRGVNMFIPHAFYYSLEGSRKDERPPDVGPGNIWWKHYRLFSDYIKRVSYIMTDSKNCAKAAVLCESENMPVHEVAQFYENQIEFNYLQKSLLKDCEIVGNKLCISDYKYEFILGETDLPIKSVTNCKEIKERDFYTEAKCKDLRVSHLVKNGVDMYFITNEGKEQINTFAYVSAEGKPIGVNLWTSEIYRISDVGNKFELNLNQYESVLILLDKSGEFSADCKKKETIIELKKLDFIADNKDDLQKTYTTVYKADKIYGNEVIVIEAEEMVECYINESFIGVSFWNSHKFKIGKHLKNGDNKLTFIVTGNIANKYSDFEVPYGIL